LVLASTRTGSPPGKPLERRQQEPPVGVLRGARRHQHEGLLARGKLDFAERLLPQERARDPQPGLRRTARVLELREGGHEREQPRDAAVHMPERGQPDALTRPVQLAAPLLLAFHQERPGEPPQP